MVDFFIARFAGVSGARCAPCGRSHWCCPPIARTSNILRWAILAQFFLVCGRVGCGDCGVESLLAARHAVCRAFLLAMVAAYYVEMLLFGFFSTYLFLPGPPSGCFRTAFAALVCMACAGMGWLSAGSAAVPLLGCSCMGAYSV